MKLLFHANFNKYFLVAPDRCLLVTFSHFSLISLGMVWGFSKR